MLNFQSLNPDKIKTSKAYATNRISGVRASLPIPN